MANYYHHTSNVIGVEKTSVTGINDIALGGVGSLYDFSSFTFDTAGTRGVYGPNLAAFQSHYQAYSWTQDTNFFNVTTDGIQRWTVPLTATYTFVAKGAEGNTPNAGTYTASPGGKGASVTFDVELTKGEIINIVVGQQPAAFTSSSMAGGGGGTFIYKDTGTVLIAAVGGGGGGGRTGFESSWTYSFRHGRAAESTVNTSLQGRDGYFGTESSPVSRGGGSTRLGATGTGSVGDGGWHGDGNNRGGGGAGWNTDGQYSGMPVTISSTYGEYLRGRSRTYSSAPFRGAFDYDGNATTSSSNRNGGGFGGGGGAGNHPYKGYGGGGGGYSGGGGASWNGGSGPAGGGSTYVPGGFTSTTAGSNSGAGSVEVTVL